MNLFLAVLSAVWMFVSMYLFGAMEDLEFTGPGFNKLFVQFVAALLCSFSTCILACLEVAVEKLKAIENANHNQDDENL